MRLMLLFLCLRTMAVAQTESQLTFRRYTIQDGLPQMQAERLWQDSRGYIYIGTLSGFVRFDGREFTPFLKGRRENIVGFAEHGGEVRALSFRRQWFIEDNNELTMEPIDRRGEWLLNNMNSSDLPNGYALLEDEQEEHRRLCRVTAAGMQPILSSEALNRMTPDRKLYLDGHTLYIPSGDIFAYRRIDGRLYAFGRSGISIVEGRRKVRNICRAPEGWQQTFYGLIVRSSEQRGGRQTFPPTVIADEHSLYTFDGRRVEQIATGFNLIKDLLIDRWGRLWVATYQGVYCYFHRTFTNHRLEDVGDIVRAVAERDGQLVTGTLNGKLMAGRQVVSDDPEQFYQPFAVTIDGTVYMAGNGDVCSYDGTQQWLQLPKDRYQFVAKAGNRLIVGSRSTVTAYDTRSRQLDTLATDVRHPWCAAQDKEGRLWVGTSLGLYCDGRLSDYPQRLVITTMDADSAGNVYFASADSLFMIRHGKVSHIDLPQLQGHEVRSLHASPRGFLVVAAVDGLFVGRLSKEGQVSQLHFFNHLNGFTMTEPLKAQMAETADGTVWLPGVEQMTSFKPADLLAYDESDTYIAPPLRWWQHWWVWLAALLLTALAAWCAARWYEEHRNRQRMIRLQREKLQQQQQIDAIRKKAIEAEPTTLAQDIVKMTERTGDERLTLRTATGTIVVEVKDIACFKADGNYSQLMTFHTTEMVLVSLGKLEKRLNPDTFARADRSTLVNIHNISQLLPRQHTCIFRSATGKEVEVTLLTPAFKRLQDLLQA